MLLFKFFFALVLMLFSVSAYTQTPPTLYIQIVSHNEPTDTLQIPIRYQNAKTKVLQLARIVDSLGAKWNLQTSDGFVMGALVDEANTTTNIFETLANSPYSDNIEIDPRSKNMQGRNIADQYHLLDSLGANPTKTVGGFLYYICQPSSMQPDWWQYTDTMVGNIYGNKIKFNLLSGAGSAGDVLHCNDLNDFGVFKPDTVDNFYAHNPARSTWCMGTGCAPLLDSLEDEQAIIDLIQGQVDSIQNGLWPQDKFYVTRIMTNQREYGPLFIQKITKVIDSLNQIPDIQLQWATMTETFTAFQAWQTATGKDHSTWRCGDTYSGVEETENTNLDNISIYPNPGNGSFQIELRDNSTQQQLYIYDSKGSLLKNISIINNTTLDISEFPNGLYLIRTEKGESKIIQKI